MAMTKRERETAEKYIKMLEQEEKEDREFFKKCKQRRSEIEAYFKKLDEQAERKSRKSALIHHTSDGESAYSAESEEDLETISSLFNY